MKPQADKSDSPLLETMSAKLEINDLDAPAQGKAITEAVNSLKGILAARIEKGALYVSYDPLATTEKKIEILI